MQLLLAGAGSAVLGACSSAVTRTAPTTAPATAVPPAPSTVAAPIELPTAARTLAATLPAATATLPAATATVPAATPTVPAATAVPSAGVAANGGALAARNRKKVWTWLRMLAVGQIPTSEADYMAHRRDIDAVMPLNGGRLQREGLWEQEDTKLDSPWARNLPRLARESGQLYMPGMSNDRGLTINVLQDTGVQEQAAAELVRLATSGRFDSPWDGVYLDIEGISYEYRSQMTGFLYRIARAVKSAGLLLGISAGGVTGSDTGTIQGDDAIDLGVAGEIADFVDLRAYDYAGNPPRSIAPYWWVESCLSYALKKGVKPQQMTLGLANFAQHYPDANSNSSEQITYDQAMQLVQQGKAQVQWIESNENGIVRESFARIGQGYVWIDDERTYGARLPLIDKYRLLGNTMFAPGMGNPAQWQALAAWAGES